MCSVYNQMFLFFFCFFHLKLRKLQFYSIFSRNLLAYFCFWENEKRKILSRNSLTEIIFFLIKLTQICDCDQKKSCKKNVKILTWNIVIGIWNSYPPVILNPNILSSDCPCSGPLPADTESLGILVSIANVTSGIIHSSFNLNPVQIFNFFLNVQLRGL